MPKVYQKLSNAIESNEEANAINNEAFCMQFKVRFADTVNGWAKSIVEIDMYFRS